MARKVRSGRVVGCETRYLMDESAAAIQRSLYSAKRSGSYRYILMRYS
jgi:hypothetical protein